MSTLLTDPVLYEAAARAVDLRQLGSQSGWSLAHMAAIYAALGRSERVAECLDTLLKGCTIANFFTLHNDYRNMGVALSWKEPPVQMDANMGFVNAVQMMLLQEIRDCLRLLPALPERLAKGSAENLHFTAGRVSMKWDMKQETMEALVTLVKDGAVRIQLPSWVKAAKVSVNGGEYVLCGQSIRLNGTKDAVLTIACGF